MMHLSKRQKEIIKILSEEEKPIKVKQLAEELKVSQRTIRYDLDKIEYFLKKIDIEIFRKPKIGIYVENRRRLIDQVREWKNDSKFIPYIDKDERLLYMGLLLSTCNNPFPSEKIADLLKTSRSTIISDLKELGIIINENFALELWAKKRYGYCIRGEESKVRDYLAYLVKEFLEMNMNGQKIYEPIEEMVELLYSFDVRKIRKAIKLGKATIPFWIPYESYLTIVARIKVLMYRIKNDKLSPTHEKITQSLKDTKEFLISKEISNHLSNIFNIYIPESEIINLTYHLIFCNLKIVNNIDTMVDPKLVDTVYEMIRSLQNYIDLKPDSIKLLKEEMISHLELTLEKVQFNIPNVNPLINEIKKKYFEEFHVAKMILEHFEKVYNVSITEDEIGFITMYIVKNKEQSSIKSNKNVLIVCCSGKGASKLLATRITNNIQKIIIKDIVSVFEIEENEYDTSLIDLIISTVPIKNASKPVIKVSPLITNNELGKISRILFNQEISEFKQIRYYSNNLLDSLRKEIIPFVHSDKENFILNKLEAIISDYEDIQKNQMLEHSDIPKDYHITGMILVEIGNMIQKLHDDNIIEYKFMNLWGLVLHVVLAIPRWKSGSFNIDPNLDYYKNNYSDIYRIIKSTMTSIESKFEFRIKDTEIVAIMRYLICE